MRFDSLTLMKGDERVELGKEHAYTLLFFQKGNRQIEIEERGLGDVLHGATGSGSGCLQPLLACKRRQHGVDEIWTCRVLE